MPCSYRFPRNYVDFRLFSLFFSSKTQLKKMTRSIGELLQIFKVADFYKKFERNLVNSYTPPIVLHIPLVSTPLPLKSELINRTAYRTVFVCGPTFLRFAQVLRDLKMF